ncbi:Tetratricopeptide repeat protein 4 [Chytridiales sp. JEL 0842]|nr:Tetratricopeptide repeat protein 4 [Chytridiales sp. JEL 0842]
MEAALDYDYDTFGPSLPSKVTDPDELLKEMQKMPLFMNSLSMDAMEDNDTLAALQSLVYDGPPEEVAMNFKNQGNDSFKDGPKFYQTAIEYYTKGIAIKAEDNDLNSTLYSNRAAVNLKLGNYRKTILDCAEAIKLNPKNIKAYYRSTVALRSVDRLAEALDSCEWGLKHEPTNKSLLEEKTKIEKRKMELEIIQKRTEERERLKALKEKQLNDAITSRGITMASSTPKLENKKHEDSDSEDEETRKDRRMKTELLSMHAPKLDETTGRLTFPVLFLYPEFSESDLISAFEEDSAFIDHIEFMFGASQPRAGWDAKGIYTPDKIEMYFETRPDLDPLKANKNEQRRLMKVDTEATLVEIISHPEYRVVDGIASFFVLSSGSSFAKTFRKTYRPKK